MGDRIIVPINLMNKIDNLPKKVKNRNNDVIIRRSSCEIDSINYIIPNADGSHEESFVVFDLTDTVVSNRTSHNHQRMH